MKEFNLDAALNGEPVNANGQKCYIVREVTEFFDDKSVRKFAVIFPDNHTNAEIWDEHDLISGDIEMWEEPKISIEYLPKSFKPKSGDKYYYINEYGISIVRCYDEDDDSDVGMAENAQCYRTKEDAQKWIDFMKSMME